MTADRFVWTRFVLGLEDVVTTAIPRNGLTLPKDDSKVQSESLQIKLSQLLLNKLREACDISL